MPTVRNAYFSDLPLRTRMTFSLVGMIARHLAFPLWYLMAMEESSTALARDIARCNNHPPRRTGADICKSPPRAHEG